MTWVAGIRGVTTGNADAIPVAIDSTGQLGTVSSSRRVKSDIRDMRDTTETIMNLHPVEFRYTAYGPDAPLQFGLLAEEVAEVAPELVVRKADGEVETVYYDKVNAMLPGVVQRQQRTIGQLQRQIADGEEAQAAIIRRLEQRCRQSKPVPPSEFGCNPHVTRPLESLASGVLSRTRGIEVVSLRRRFAPLQRTRGRGSRL